MSAARTGRALALARGVERLDVPRRAKAAGIHLLVSAAVAVLAAVLVFGLWYPGPFRFMAGGRSLFLLVASVDVVIGPVLTFAVFNAAKGKRHLRRDIATIGLLQLLALAYGLHTVYMARPVAMVYEVDRFRMVTAGDVLDSELPRAPARYRRLPLLGPWLIAARRPESGAERNDALFMGVSGVDVGQRPSFWQDYEIAKPRALERSRPVALLLQQYPDQAGQLNEQLRAIRADPSTSRFLPTMARAPWVAILDASGEVLGYIPADGFF